MIASFDLCSKFTRTARVKHRLAVAGDRTLDHFFFDHRRRHNSSNRFLSFCDWLWFNLFDTIFFLDVFRFRLWRFNHHTLRQISIFADSLDFFKKRLLINKNLTMLTSFGLTLFDDWRQLFFHDSTNFIGRNGDLID